MVLSNTINKGAINRYFPLASDVSTPDYVSFEYPLNHGKRLGVIRLNPFSLTRLTAINSLRQQLIAWKKETRLLAIWFEYDQTSSRGLFAFDFVNDALGKQNQMKLSLKRLIDCIQDDSKLTLFWQEKGANKQVVSLIENAHLRLGTSTKPPLNKRFVSNPFQPSLLRKTCLSQAYLPEEYQVTCKRHLFLERLSNYPWNDESCKNLELNLKKLIMGFSAKASN
ncbi:GTP-binding protein EngA [Marinomonas sp. MED121]|uniref:hypothetical protein n=1 Tax=Marinomonas sp. MED121 TaxID=314277 RepID=UPI00006910F2|nr:hypothetical protein [Marinomonas sp. MED121]EAQ67372.1 GTP-binding protein EngA [Marinomonas sp. MED121]